MDEAEGLERVERSGTRSTSEMGPADRRLIDAPPLAVEGRAARRVEGASHKEQPKTADDDRSSHALSLRLRQLGARTIS